MLWWSRECVLYLIIIIKPEVWIINHCLGLGHETMVCAVCLTMFLLVGMDCIFLNRCYQQWLRIKNCLSKHKYFVNIKSDLCSIFLVKQHNTQKWPKNSYIFLILEPIGRFVHCKKCSPPNMANKMSLNTYLDHHLCLIFQIWLHNNASWQKGHLIVHLANILRLICLSQVK